SRIPLVGGDANWPSRGVVGGDANHGNSRRRYSTIWPRSASSPTAVEVGRGRRPANRSRIPLVGEDANYPSRGVAGGDANHGKRIQRRSQSLTPNSWNRAEEYLYSRSFPPLRYRFWCIYFNFCLRVSW